jgi:hypothetical protein
LPPLLGGLSSFGSIYLSGSGLKLRRETKTPFPPAKRNGDYRERLQPDSPTGLSFSTARRERSEDLSHIRKTLNPGVPGHPPHSIFRCLRAVACLPRGRLAYRGSTASGSRTPAAQHPQSV